MTLTILLAKILGVYLLITGVALISRKRFFMSAMGAFIEDKAIRMALVIMDLIFGLFIVNLHPLWSPFPALIITLIGWLALLKGGAALFLKDSTLSSISKSVSQKWYFVEGFLVLLIGLYLSAYGFHWF
jgi:hypothetical protein